ncbi:glycosyltransferase [Hyella patelloides]
MKELRVAWLLSSAFYYWQPSISEFSKLFPHSKVFTGRWVGFAKGYENSLDVEIVGERKVLRKASKKPGYGLSFTYLSPSIVSYLFRFKPDLIFSNAFGVWTILALLFKFIGNWQVIIIYEGSAPGVDFLDSFLRLGIRRLMMRLADGAISNSQAGMNYLTKVLEGKKERVWYHPIEIPSSKTWTETLRDTQLSQLQLNNPVFLFVGRLLPRKGLHLLLEACHLLKTQGYKFSLLVVGDGEQRTELETYCREHGLEDCVYWMGFVAYEKLSAYFERADVFVLPTFEDTWGVAVLEAMLFGKPVFCSQGAGTAELIVDGENGYVFEPMQTQQLAELMAKAIANPEQFSLMGEKSRQTMAQYTPEAAASFLTQVVEAIVNKKKVTSNQ